jgi:hypothetical protein
MVRTGGPRNRTAMLFRRTGDGKRFAKPGAPRRPPLAPPAYTAAASGE